MIRSEELQAIIDKWKGILTTDRLLLEKRINGQIKVDQSTVSRNLKERDILNDNEKENVSVNEQSNKGVYNPEKSNKKQNHENSVLIKNGQNASSDNFLIVPSQNGNRKLSSYESQSARIQRGLNKNLLPIDVRECEKERFAKLCENSQSKFGKIETDKSYSLVCGDSTLNSRNDKSKSMPSISEREKEINRLAELFEKSSTSRIRVESQQLDCRPNSSVSSSNVRIDESHQNEPFINSSSHQFSTNILNGDSVRNNASSNVDTITIPSVHMSAPVTSSKSLLTGFGEHDYKRKQLIEQRKKDYCDYMNQTRLRMHNTRPEIQHSQSNNVSARDVAVQTDVTCVVGAFDRPSYLLDNNDSLLSNNTNEENNAFRSAGASAPVSPIMSAESHSKIQSADASDTHMKQYIYGEQLKKQIEEKQKLDAERKEREKREEEAMERRCREQQERLRRQYEIEEAQRVTFRRRVHDEQLHQRLTQPEIAGVQCNYMNYGKQHRPTILPCSSITPFLSSGDRPLPLLEKRNKPRRKNTSNTPMMTSTANYYAKSAIASNDTTKIADQGAVVLSKEPSKPLNLNRSNSRSNICNNDNIKHIDPLVGVDLLGDNIYGNSVSDNIRSEIIDSESDELGSLNNVIDRTDDIKMINDRSHAIDSSRSPAVPALQTKSRLTSNTRLLEDKWQVPAVEKTYIRPTVSFRHPQPVQLLQSNLSDDVIGDSSNRNNNNYNDFHSGRSNNVLTHLGSFRRQLQLDHLKLQEKFYNQQLGTAENNQENIKTPVSVATSTM